MAGKKPLNTTYMCTTASCYIVAKLVITICKPCLETVLCYYGGFHHMNIYIWESHILIVDPHPN